MTYESLNYAITLDNATTSRPLRQNLSASEATTTSSAAAEPALSALSPPDGALPSERRIGHRLRRRRRTVGWTPQ